MILRTFKIKVKQGLVWREMDDIEAGSWFEGQELFTRKLRQLIADKYVRFEDKEDAKNFGIDFIGPGLYPKRTGDVLLDSKIYDTFSTDSEKYTIRVLSK